MSMTPPACWVAKVCFTVAPLLVMGKIVILTTSAENSVWERTIITFVLFGIIGIGWVESIQWVRTRELLQIVGVLTPNNKPTPPNPCGSIPPNALVLFLGDSASYTTAFPHTVIEVGQEQILIINKEKDKITLSAKLFSRDGKIVAELKDNKFFINPNNYFRIDRPNFHTLIVYDQEAKQILNVEYINPSVIKFLGIFYLPNRLPIIINEDWQEFGTRLRLSACCFGENKVDIHID